MIHKYNALCSINIMTKSIPGRILGYGQLIRTCKLLFLLWSLVFSLTSCNKTVDDQWTINTVENADGKEVGFFRNGKQVSEWLFIPNGLPGEVGSPGRPGRQGIPGTPAPISGYMVLHQENDSVFSFVMIDSLPLVPKPYSEVVLKDVFTVQWSHNGRDTDGQPTVVQKYELALNDSIFGISHTPEFRITTPLPAGEYVFKVRAWNTLPSTWAVSTDSAATNGNPWIGKRK